MKAGEQVTMRITVRCRKESEYVMIEAPVPAGCIQVNKEAGYRWPEAAREYFRDQTDIFYSKLPPGLHTFDIAIEGRYRGSYNVSPARASMMYFPGQYGHTGVTRVTVR